MNIRQVLHFKNAKKQPQNSQIVRWCENSLEIKLNSYQRDFLNKTTKEDQIFLGHWFRRSGKSLTLIALALYNAYVLNKSSIIISPNDYMTRDMSCNLMRSITSHSNLNCSYRKSINHLTEHLFNNGSCIYTVSPSSISATNTMCGLSVPIILIDEIEYLDKTAYKEFVIPMLCTKYSKLIALSSTNCQAKNDFLSLSDYTDNISNVSASEFSM